MKFKYQRTEDNDVNILLNDERAITFILHFEEIDIETDDEFTDEEINSITDWVIEKFGRKEECGEAEI